LASVIIPLYHSWNTLGGCLDALAAQSEKRFETILADSSEDDRARRIAERYPRTTYLYSKRRLRPQAARNFGAERAASRLLVFTDPDIYPAKDWLATLLRRYEEAPAILFGPIACHGRRWVDRGVHLCKFNVCLPGGEPRPVRLGWSGNALIPRDAFDALGGWDMQHTQGDSVFSARARAAGYALRLEPGAVVDHDHEGVPVSGLFRERFARGREFAEIEAAGKLDASPRVASGAGHALRKILAMPLRVGGGLLRIARSAAAAGMTAELLMTFPVVLIGVMGWYAGMADGWRRTLTGRSPAP
jgi:glycosyltransferase involved in cell wall biosynthesis